MYLHILYICIYIHIYIYICRHMNLVVCAFVFVQQFVCTIYYNMSLYAYVYM